MLDLESAIKHCEEVAEEQENFENFKCGYCKPGCEDGVWKDTCRLPSNIPTGYSWGECSEQNCPLFHECLECAKEHRQLAEWLRELKKYRVAHYKLRDMNYEYDLNSKFGDNPMYYGHKVWDVFGDIDASVEYEVMGYEEVNADE